MNIIGVVSALATAALVQVSLYYLLQIPIILQLLTASPMYIGELQYPTEL